MLNEFGQHYVYVAAGLDDPNAAREEKVTKTPELEVEKAPEKKVNWSEVRLLYNYLYALDVEKN